MSEVLRCFWRWPFGHYWQPGIGADGHPAWVCRDCPKAISSFGWEWRDVTPKQPGRAAPGRYHGKWAGR